MLKDYEKLMSHAPVLFPGDKINNKYLKMYTDYLKVIDDAPIEVSKKIKNDEVDLARLNIFFRSDFRRNFLNCIMLLTRNGFDVKEVLDTVYQFRFDQIDNIVFGIALGENESQTRIKLHVMYLDYPGLKEKVLALPQTLSCVSTFIPAAHVELAFDLAPNKPVAFRNYLFFKNPFRIKALFEQEFGKELAEIICSYNDFWMSGKEKDAPPFLYFFKSDDYPVIDTVERLKFKNFNQKELLYQNRFPYIFGTSLENIQSCFLTEYNLYYML